MKMVDESKFEELERIDMEERQEAMQEIHTNMSLGPFL